MIGWPIPEHRPSHTGDVTVYLRLPLFGLGRPDGVSGATPLFPPFALLTLNWVNGTVAEYADFRYTRPWPLQARPAPVGLFPHPAIASLSVEEYRWARADLLARYDDLFEALRAGASFKSGGAFGTLLHQLLEPALLPFYRTLAPEFTSMYFGQGPTAADVLPVPAPRPAAAP
jgi:hypothetical protein